MIPGLILYWVLTNSFSDLSGQEPGQIKVPGLEKILKNQEDKLFVVNMWATWCGPCVTELPAFQKVAKEYNPAKVSFIMISLDFPSQIQTQLIPFLKKNNISLNVSVMTELDYNAWIDKIDPSWQGSIPATLFFNNADKTRHFHEGALTETELRKLLDKYL